MLPVMFQAIRGVQPMLDVQAVFTEWTTKPCLFSEFELYKGPSILFMRWIAFLPELGVFLPEGMLLGMQEL